LRATLHIHKRLFVIEEEKHKLLSSISSVGSGEHEAHEVHDKISRNQCHVFLCLEKSLSSCDLKLTMAKRIGKVKHVINLQNQ
jgi:hypothetical protein